MALERFSGIRRRVRSAARDAGGSGRQRVERRLVVPVGDVELAAVAAVAARCPDELAAVRRRHGQAVEAVRVGDPDRFLRALRVDDEDLEVLETELVRGEEDVLARGVLVRGPAHRAEVGQLPLVGAVGVHRPDIGDQAVLAEAPPDDAGTVGEEEGAAVVSGHVREPGLFAAVGAHDVDLAEVRGIDFQQVRFALGELPVVGVAGGGEDDPLAVRGNRRLRRRSRGRSSAGAVLLRPSPPSRSPFPGRNPRRSAAPDPKRGSRVPAAAARPSAGRGGSTRTGSPNRPAG